MHHENPVLRVERFVLLSFLYDSEGAMVRRANMENTELLDGKYKDSIDENFLQAYVVFSIDSRYSSQYNLN